MNLVTHIDQINKFQVFFGEPIKNNMLNDGVFVRIIISTDKLTLNGIYLVFDLEDTICEKYFNKYKLIFNEKKNSNIIKKIQYLEEHILSKYKCDKHKQYKISEQLNSSHIKLFNPTYNKQLLLKISGIWETSYSYGITFKFYPSVV
jgi:hypothetical protein